MFDIFADISWLHVDPILVSTHGFWHVSNLQEAIDEWMNQSINKQGRLSQATLEQLPASDCKLLEGRKHFSFIFYPLELPRC